MLALAGELRRRGHAVTIATSEFYREKISALDFTFQPLRPALPVDDIGLIAQMMDGVRGPVRLLRDLIFPAVRDMHADLAPLAARADLLVTSELVYAAPILAEQTGVRWVSFSLAPLSIFSACDPSVPPLPLGGEWVRAVPPFALRWLAQIPRAFLRPWWRPVRQLRRELGLPPGGNPFFDGKFSPRLDLALFSSVLAPPQPDWPLQTVQTGFCFFDETDPASRLPPAVENFLAAGELPIVFTLGSSAVFAAGDFYEQSAAAAQRLGRRALLLLGKNPPPPGLPPTILAWDYLPYAQIFPHAAAVVHQGGVGTTAQALRAGRPMLVVPFAFDQPDNAARVTRLGVGRTLARSRCTAHRIAREFAALLGPSRPAQLAAEAGALIRAERGGEFACDALERALR
jgi:UDP:flavonoid glycosyltransferase YjiC (YdhE family)